MNTNRFEEALRAALPVVRQRLARRYGDEQLAEEVGWDCLTKAYEVWRANPGYFDAHDLTRWASNRANWRALDVLRKRAFLVSLGEDRDDGEAPCAPLVDRHADEDAVRWERDREAVYAAVRRLGDEDRSIVEGYYYDNETDQGIGGRLYGDEGSNQARGLRVWRRRRKAHAQLQSLLAEQGIDPTDYSPAGHQAV